MSISLKEQLSGLSLRTMRDIYEGRSDKNYINFLDAFGKTVQDDSDLKKLEELISYPKFQEFLRNNINSSAKRFTRTLEKLANLLIQSVSIEPIKNIVNAMTEPVYKKALKVYFTPPVDYDLYDVFETELFTIVIQNPDLIPGYIHISDEFGLKDIKMTYHDHTQTLTIMMNKLRRLYIIHHDPQYVLEVIKFVTDDMIYRYVEYYESIESENDLDRLNDFLDALFGILINIQKEQLNFVRKAMGWIKRYTLPGNQRTVRKILMIKILNLLRAYFMQPETADLHTYFEMYPYIVNHPHELIWIALFECVPPKIPRYIQFFISPAFNRFLKHYQYNSDILFFLMKHILMLLREIDIEGFPSSLMPVVLQLLIDAKVDMNFLRKRQFFAKWLAETNSSAILESFFIRILLYEYIFIHKDLFEKEPQLKLTRFLDPFHQQFCAIIDEKLPPYAREEERIPEYQQLYELARAAVWAPVFQRFEKFRTQVLELAAICESFDIDDLFLTEIEKVPDEYFTQYFYPIKSAIKTNPDNMEEIRIRFIHDYWSRLYFRQASSHIYRVLIKVVGLIDVYPDQENSAHTDGKDIFLPQYISKFPDDPDELEGNRNLTMYIAFALHEAGHIIGGSFKFNFRLLVAKMKHPQLFHLIFNIVEDFRIEHYLFRIKPHSQAKDILIFANLRMSLSNVTGNVIYDFLVMIYDSAYEMLDKRYEFDPQSEKVHQIILNLKLPCGRFRNMRNFSEYCVERIKNINLFNPFASFYLADEIYNVIRFWPPEQIAEAEGERGVYSDNLLEGEHHVMTEEELKRMYDDFNNDPKAVFEQYGIPVYDQLFSDDDSKKAPSGDDHFVDQVSPDSIKQILISEEFDYEEEGTFDVSVHTKVDDLAAERQKEMAKDTGKKKPNIFETIFKKKKEKTQSSKPAVKQKRILSLSKKTNTRILVNNCYEHTIDSIDRLFLKSAKRYDYIIRRIAQILAGALENKEETTYEYSSLEGDIDPERLIEILTDPNHHSDEEFLEYSDEQKKTLRAIIGMDVSGSTMMPIDEQMRTPTTVLDIEKYFALIFSKSLKIITHSVDVYAFDSMTSTNIYHALPMEALSSFHSGAANRDGDFIRYMKYIFSQSEEDLKYFFLITDGSPSSANYEGKYAMDDTLLAMRECKKEGIRLFYFNIDRELRDYFTLFKQEAFYAEHFQHPEQLIKSIPNLITGIANEVV